MQPARASDSMAPRTTLVPPRFQPMYDSARAEYVYIDTWSEVGRQVELYSSGNDVLNARRAPERE